MGAIARVATSGRCRLVATDLDGTLLRSDGSVSSRARTALSRLAAIDVTFILVSGRPPRAVRRVADSLGTTGLAICCNGALIYDLDSGSVVYHRTIDTTATRSLVTQLRTRVPGVGFAVERALEFGAEPLYLDLRAGRTEPVAWQDDAIALCAEPITKLIAYHDSIGVEALQQVTREIMGDTVYATYSGAGFLEIAPAGVDKGMALAWVCQERGLAAGDVLAFGDMINDLPMLRWAGRSIAVANAHPEVLASVAEVTLSNDDDGVADVLERLIGQL